MLPEVDYSTRLFTGYAAGRALTATTLETWREAFGRGAPRRRPLAVLDLGCGVGRFSPVLADVFGGPVYGVEPARRMREVAARQNGHPRVTYLDGDANTIPLGDDTCDLALLFLMLHHVPDQPAAAREIARVLRPGGRVLLQSSFSGELEDRRWFHHFPRAREIENVMFPSRAAVLEMFAAAGFTHERTDLVECEIAPSLAAYADKLRHRAIPTFEHLTEEEIKAGLASIDEAVARETVPVPVLEPAELQVFALR
ncbi:class I SAM-dependent methyltransferase [Kibdelosporangium phytohabitans]|uniref:Methyltransferase type 11 domain-containing protein n=1 Tax=Kibdelosporangium phytohabitans TaxID=860235 RepID=A0A0N9I1H6_9PSEU|nr:class I SAM-dependent methyltransferase [Kibdelosporangium phytohabitans]ALG08283.1 hypothetical protein AOZ06_16430 [Kibdelosporangium phytohabitans]MBE1470693.1 ubiquinone/menaquinone biosynthesis C-methylase UbiE [Kibdelosporangium phytohabitans]